MKRAKRRLRALRFGDRQWRTIEQRAAGEGLDPKAWIRKRLFSKDCPVEKRETIEVPVQQVKNTVEEFRVNLDEVLREDERSAIADATAWAPTSNLHSLAFYSQETGIEPVGENPVVRAASGGCSFCNDSGQVWLNGKQVECPRCSA